MVVTVNQFRIMKKVDKSRIEYAALTINTDIENRSEAEYIKAKLKSQALHYPLPIIYTVNDKNKLELGKNS